MAPLNRDLWQFVPGVRVVTSLRIPKTWPVMSIPPPLRMPLVKLREPGEVF